MVNTHLDVAGLNFVICMMFVISLCVSLPVLYRRLTIKKIFDLQHNGALSLILGFSIMSFGVIFRIFPWIIVRALLYTDNIKIYFFMKYSFVWTWIGTFLIILGAGVLFYPIFKTYINSLTYWVVWYSGSVAFYWIGIYLTYTLAKLI